VAKETKATLETRGLDVVADRGYFSGEQILACEGAGITVTLPRPMTSNSKAEGRFGNRTSASMFPSGRFTRPRPNSNVSQKTMDASGFPVRLPQAIETEQPG